MVPFSLRIFRFYFSNLYIAMGNFSKKMTSAVSIATLLASTLSMSAVSAASEFATYAQVLADNDVISAQSTEAGYRLGDTVTRAELAKITANLGGYTATECSGDVYGDVDSKLGDLCGYVEALAEAGVVSTSNANFRPTAPVTRAEMVKMLLGAVGETGSDTDAGYMDVANLGDLATYVNRANELGCAADATYFRPNATSSRGEAFKVAACVAQLEPVDTEEGTGEEEPTTSTGTTSTGVTTVVGGGALAVSLDGTAVAQYVPKNASSVKVGTVKLAATDKDVTVRSLVVTRSGLGNANDIASTNGVRAAINGVVVSSSADYYNATSQKATVYFSPALVVKAGSSTSVDVLVNLNGAENSQHQFALDSVNTDGTVTGAPVTLGLLNTTSYQTTTTTANVVASAGTVTPGKAAQSIVKVEMNAGGRDTKVTGFTLTRSGSTDFTKRLSNAVVYRNGVAVGTVSMTNEKLSVSGLADVLQSGNTQTYEIKADVLVDSSSSVLGFKWDSTTDISASEVATGYATQVTATPTTGAAIAFTNVEVTFTKNSTGSVTLAPGTNNVKFFNGKLTSAVPLTVRALTITPTLTASGINAFVNDQLSVKLNGAEIATLTVLTGGLAQPKTVSFVVDSANPATLTIEGSIKNNQSVNGSFTFQVALSDVRDSSNNSATIGAGNNLTGDKTTVNTAVVELKTATVAAPSTTRLYSSADQEIARFALTARNEAARVQKLTLTGTVTGAAGNLLALASSNSSIKLVDVATNAQISATANIVGNVVTFDSMNDTIPMDVTRNYKVVLTTTSLDTFYGSTVALALNAAGTSVVRDSNSNSVMPTGTTTTKTYTVGTVAPTVIVTAVSENVFKVKVTNPDSNTGITLTSAKFDLKTALPGNTSYSATACLRDLGNTLTCGGGAGVSTQTGAVPSLAQTIAVTGLTTNMTADKNNGTVEFEVYVTSANLLPVGGQLQVALTQLNYTVGGSADAETYVGTVGASATFTK
jgi:S-layer homology domain